MEKRGKIQLDIFEEEKRIEKEKKEAENKYFNGNGEPLPWE